MGMKGGDQPSRRNVCQSVSIALRPKGRILQLAGVPALRMRLQRRAGWAGLRAPTTYSEQWVGSPGLRCWEDKGAEGGVRQARARPLILGNGPACLPVGTSQSPAGLEEERLEEGMGHWSRVGG